MKGGSVSVVCKGYITKVVWRAILALMGAWGPHKLVISDTDLRASDSYSRTPSSVLCSVLLPVMDQTNLAEAVKV